MSLSQEFQHFIAQLRASPVRLDQLTDIDELRTTFNALSIDSPPLTDVVLRQVDAAGVPAEWVEPTDSDPSRVIFYLHGGGYVAGDPVVYRSFVCALCRASGYRALMVDYRLAPGSPFPAALEDTLRSYAWLLTQEVSADHIVIMGDSAGGGLALSTLVSLRDNGQPLPAAGVLLSPWTNLTLESDSHVTKVNDDPIITHKFLDQSRQHYLGTGANAKDARVSPLYANLTGLPPLLVLVGTAEVLLDDSTVLVDKAREAGVDAELITGEGMIHTWPFFIHRFPEASKAVQNIGTYIHSRVR